MLQPRGASAPNVKPTRKIKSREAKNWDKIIEPFALLAQLLAVKKTTVVYFRTQMFANVSDIMHAVIARLQFQHPSAFRLQSHSSLVDQHVRQEGIKLRLLYAKQQSKEGSCMFY